MSSNVKVFLGIIIFSLIMIIGAVMILSGSSVGKVSLQKQTGVKIEVSEDKFSFDEIDYDGGNVSHGFKIKNIGDKDLVVANIITSCMCTKAFMKGPFGEGPKSGMKGMSKPSDWKGVLKVSEEGEIVAVFDPAFHGPSGVGPLSRNVSFETNDPDKPYVELTFDGNVVKK